MVKDKKNQSKIKKPSISAGSKGQKNFYYGKDSFTLPNMDTYVGEYCAHRNGMIWREGRGSYKTQDGHIYEGLWRDDKLVDLRPIKISYPNGNIFEGTLSKNKYEGNGNVIFPGGLRLSANFKANKPVGMFHLIDSTGQLWKQIPQDEKTNLKATKIICRPEQIFFNNIHPLRGVKKQILRDIEPAWATEGTSDMSDTDEASEETVNLTEKDWEKIIFAKKPKVDDTMDWENFPWYQSFATFKHRRQTILSKVEHHETLTDDEKKWYGRYAMSRRQKRNQLNYNETVDTNQTALLEKFYSETHRQSAKPYSTYYPTYYWHTPQEEQETDESLQEYTESIEEQPTEHFEYIFEESSSEENQDLEECVTPNPSIACGTSSLFGFVETATGITINNPCKSQL